MDFLKRMTEVIDYVEEHINEDFNLSDVAKIVCCNAYQFGRIFSYVVGISLAEYIRNRRLSLAALELQSAEVKVIDAALKYGYNSPESFARAFREMHGVTPKEARIKGVKLRMYPRIAFQIFIKGAVNMDYRIEEKGTIKCIGSTYHFAKDDNRWWNAWDKYLHNRNEKSDKTLHEIIRDVYKLYRAPLWQVSAAHDLEDGSLDYSIGAAVRDGEEYPGIDSFEIPAATWAMFSGKGSIYDGFAALLTRIFSEWLPSSGYEQSMPYTIEIYPPENPQISAHADNDYAFEIWIPVKKK